MWLQTYMYCKALEDIGSLLVDTGDASSTIDMAEGDIHIVTYPVVADLVKNDRARLL